MHELYEQFLSEVPQRFAYLEDVYQFSRHAWSGEWYARIVYTGASSEVSVSLGDREFCGKVLVARPLPGAPGLTSYALWEWLAALGVTEAEPSYVEWIQTQDQLSRFLIGASAALESALAKILDAGPSVTLTLERAREQVRAAQHEAEQARAHRSATAQAAEAFRSREFSKVVSLLAPFETDLSAAERRKLDYSRKQVQGAA